ncbi:MAG: hypothetical protein IJJ85_08235 [Clostridia bacterium]|nr:hypothetical protein [Clostridia bacterium]
MQQVQSGMQTAANRKSVNGPAVLVGSVAIVLVVGIVTAVLIAIGLKNKRENEGLTPLPSDTVTVTEAGDLSGGTTDMAASGGETAAGQTAEEPSAAAAEWTEETLYQYYMEANSFYMKWIETRRLTCDWDTQISRGNESYALVQETEYASVDEIRQKAATYFEESIYADVLQKNYVEDGGKLYKWSVAGQGGDSPISSPELTIKEADAGRAVFSISYQQDGTVHEAVKGEVRFENGVWIFTDPFPASMVLADFVA